MSPHPYLLHCSSNLFLLHNIGYDIFSLFPIQICCPRGNECTLNFFLCYIFIRHHKVAAKNCFISITMNSLWEIAGNYLAYQEYLYLWKQNVHYQYTKTHFKSVKSSPHFQSYVLHSVQFNINFSSYTSASHIFSFHEASQPKFCTHLVLLCQPHVQTIS